MCRYGCKLNSNLPKWETGAYTPIISGGTITEGVCEYYKLGQLVFVCGALWGNGDGSSDFVSLSLPYQATSRRNYGIVGYFPSSANYPNLHTVVTAEIGKILFEYGALNTVTQITGAEWGTCQFNIWYITNGVKLI